MNTKEKAFRPLMNIVFPEKDFLDVPELFYRSGKCLYGFEGGIRREGCRYSFDTWINLFAVEKWRSYCDLGEIFIRLYGKGKFQAELVGHKLNAGFGIISEPIEFFDCDLGSELSTQELHLDMGEEFDAVSLHLTMAKGASLKEAVWGTNRAPLRQNRIAVAVSNFKCKKYIQSIMGSFHAFMESCPAMQERFHLFVADHGKSLEQDSSPYITVLSTGSAGGTEGLARCLMEANDGGYSRCIFMDGDVEILPETFFRTLMLSDYLREEYKDAFLDGVVLNLNKKNILTESLAVSEGFLKQKKYAGCSVTSTKDALRCIQADAAVWGEEIVNSSWRYVCWSLSEMKDEYPMPTFGQGRYVEWFWRRPDLHHIVLNGVCVWHAPLDWQKSRIEEYYYKPRDMFLGHAIHDKNFSEEFEEAFIHIFESLVQTLDYSSADLFLTSMKDILAGGKVFQETSFSQHERLAAVYEEPETVSCGDKGKLFSLRTLSMRAIEGNTGMAMDFNTDLESYRGKSKVKVFNLLKESYELRTRDEYWEQSARREFKSLLYQIGINYDALAEHLRGCHEEFKKRSFWDKYLGMEG